MALTDNLVHYWKLDESSGNASDSVGSITLTNTGTVPYAAAKIGNGITGSGSGQDMRSSSEPLTYAQLAGAFSINLWAKRIGNPSGASYAYRLNGTSGGNYRSFILYYYSAGGWHLNMTGGDSALTYSESGNLDMLTITYNGAGTFKFYVNGSQSGSNISLSMGSTAGSVSGMGLLGDGIGNNDFNIQEDEVGVWTKELTSGEITELYNSGAGLQYPFTPSFIGQFNRLPKQAIVRASNY